MDSTRLLLVFIFYSLTSNFGLVETKITYHIRETLEFPWQPSSPPSSPPLSQPPPPSPPSSPLSMQHTRGNDDDDGGDKGERKDKEDKLILIILVVVSSVVFLALGYFVGNFLRKKIKKRREKVPEIVVGDGDRDISTVESIQYDFGKIRDATNDFSDDHNKLGQGGFGAVYKGKLENGKEIAVKRLSRESGQGDSEFKNEVLLVARLQHRNLVRLLGFSIQGIERLLVYEFVHNGSLDRFIFDGNNSSSLNWESRLKIIGGIARGLLYLHEDSRVRIIHRDLKSSNVLLDEDMNPKISDFGLAKQVVPDATQETTSRIIGTYGYMAPEYVSHGYFSTKSDVYSFGVLMLEILSGRKNIFLQDGRNAGDLLSFAWRSWREGASANVINPVLMGSREGDELGEMVKCIHIALLCVQQNPEDRPTMASVVLMLSSSSSSLTLPVPLQPRFYIPGTSSEASMDRSTSTKGLLAHQQRSLYSSTASLDESSVFHVYPR